MRIRLRTAALLLLATLLLVSRASFAAAVCEGGVCRLVPETEQTADTAPTAAAAALAEKPAGFICEGDVCLLPEAATTGTAASLSAEGLAAAPQAAGSYPAWLTKLVKGDAVNPLTGTEILMFSVGMLGQILFTFRFVIQWVESERRKESYMPVAFWYFSIGGSALLLVYSISIWALPLILGQLFGTIIYARNLSLIARKKAETASAPPPPVG